MGLWQDFQFAIRLKPFHTRRRVRLRRAESSIDFAPMAREEEKTAEYQELHDPGS